MEKMNPFPVGKGKRRKAALSQKAGLFLSRGVLVLFLASLLYWTLFFHHRLPAVTDALMHVYPDKMADIREWRAGFVPLWNTDWGCGMPQAAVWQSMCFYPLAWIWGILGNPDTLVAFCLGHSLLAFLGCLLWLRSLGANLLACRLGGLCFSGSAFAVECWAYPHHTSAFTWIPWIFWASHRLLAKPVLGRWLPLTLFLGLQVLAGYPIFVLYTWVLLVSWWVSRNPSGKSILSLAGAFFASLLLTSLQWLPFLDLLTDAHRGGWWTDFPYFMKPVEYLTLLEPDILGSPASNLYRGTPANFAFNLYIGIVPLGVLLAGSLRLWKRKKDFRIWPLSAFFLLLWMGGARLFPAAHFPARFLEWLEPSKSTPLFIFCASTGASLAFSSFLANKRGSKMRLVWMGVGLLWALDIFHVPFQITHAVPNPYQSPEWKSNARDIRRLVSNGRIVSLTSNPLRFSGEKALEKSVEVPVGYFLADTNAAMGIASADFYMSIQPLESMNLGRYINLGFPYGGDLLDVAGVRLFLLPQILPDPKYRLVGRLGEDYLNFNTRASQPLRFVAGKDVLPTRPAVLNRLARSGSGWRKKVYLEGKKEVDRVQLSSVSRILDFSPVTGLARPGDGRAAFQGNFAKPGYVVFNETCLPGWHAWVDGKPFPILRAYGLFMAVPVEAGGHQVDFRYEPATFRLGLFLSLATLAGLIAACRWARVRPKAE